MKNILDIPKEKCTGCGCCSSICWRQAIEMKLTQEGFLYPYIDFEKCSMCGECEKVCVVNQQKKNEEGVRYIFSAGNDICWKSPGGGILYILAEQMIRSGGAVCAPCWSGDFMSVSHKLLTDLSELKDMCQVRYVESDASDFFENLKKSLEDKEQRILFIGNPCEVLAVENKFKKDSERLITVATRCGGVSSSFVWRGYLESRVEDKEISAVKLWSKELGIRESIRIQYEFDSQQIYEELETGDWITHFRKGLFLRKSCYDCILWDGRKGGDFVVGIMNDAGKRYNGGKGASLVYINSSKAESFWSTMPQDSFQLSEAAEIGENDLLPEHICEKNWEERKDFFVLCETHGFEHAILYHKNGTMKFEKQKRVILDYHAGDQSIWKILNKTVWREVSCDGYTLLLANGGKWQRIFLELKNPLIKNMRYTYDIKFKVKTNVNNVRFMLANEAAQNSKFLVFSQAPSKESWSRVRGSFTCSLDGMRYLMLASTDFPEADNMICIDWVKIEEG